MKKKRKKERVCREPRREASQRKPRREEIIKIEKKRFK